MKKSEKTQTVLVDTPATRCTATMGVGSDAYPYIVVAVLSPKRILVRQIAYAADTEKGYDYFSNQVYKYFPNQKIGEPIEVSLRKNGTWVEVGGKKNCGSRFHLGYFYAYQNPSF